MPLVKGHTREAISQNIKTEVESGTPRRQAIAIALNTARTAAKKAGRKLKGMLSEPRDQK